MIVWLVHTPVYPAAASFYERFYGGLQKYYNQIKSDLFSSHYLNDVPVTPSTEGISTVSEKITLITADGLSRHGVLTLRTPAKGNVVLCHPAAYDKDSMIPYEEKVFSQYNCIRFDFRRHGEDTDGQMTTLGKMEINEVLAAINIFKSRPDTCTLPLYGFGISMGAAVLLELESQQPQFDALIIQSTFESMKKQVKRLFPLFRLPLMQALIFTSPIKFYAEKRYRIALNRVEPLEAIKKIDAPIFLIHAYDDPIIGFDAYEKLHTAGKSIIKTWTPPRGLHTAILRTFPELYIQHCSDFLKSVTSRSSRIQTAAFTPIATFAAADLTSTSTNFKRIIG